MFGFRRTKWSISSIEKLVFSLYNVVKRYDTVFCRNLKTFFVEQNSERIGKLV